MAKNEDMSLDDFEEEENLLDIEEDFDNLENGFEEEEELEEEEEEEEEEEKPKSKKKKETEEEEEEEEEDSEALTDEEIKALKEKPVEELTEEEKELLQKLDSEEEEDDGTFWEDVEAITGVKLEVDYGDVDPESPAGAALREDAVVKNAVDSFLENLKTTLPKAYKALEFASNGGEIEELFKPGEKDYSKIEIKDDDDEHAKAVLSEYYLKKGFSETKVKRMVEADEDSDEGAVVNAREVLKELADAQAGEREARAKAQADANLRQQEQDKAMINTVDSIIEKGTLNSYVIPKKEREEFSSFVKQSLQRDGKGGYIIVTPVDTKDIETQLQTEFLKYKKGDLDSLIVTKKTTAKTRTLKKVAKKTSSSKLKGTGSSTKEKGIDNMSDFNE